MERPVAMPSFQASRRFPVESPAGGWAWAVRGCGVRRHALRIGSPRILAEWIAMNGAFSHGGANCRLYLRRGFRNLDRLMIPAESEPQFRR